MSNDILMPLLERVPRRPFLFPVKALSKVFQGKSVKKIMLELTGQDISTCPFCKKGKLNKILKIPEQTGPGFFERLNLSTIKDTS